MNDEDWLEVMRGKRPGDGSLSAEEAQLLRRTIIEADADAIEVASRDVTFDRLLFRLRREGLLDGRSSNYSWRSMAAACAVVGVLGVMVASLQPEHRGDSETLRGSPSVTVAVPEPRELASRVEVILKSYGATANRTDLQDGGLEVRASIPLSSLAAARNELGRLGIAVPDNGQLVVDIVKR